MNEARVALGPREIEELRLAKRLLERPSLAATLTDWIGRPIEGSIRLLPERIVARIHALTRTSLDRALDVALRTLADPRPVGSSERAHKLATAAAGATGGFFGLIGLAVELPVTTVLMLRSVADIARSEGFALLDPRTRLDCIEVFALGGPGCADDAAETGYYAVRTAMSKAVSDAVRHVAERGMVSRGAPVMVQLLEKVAARFGLVVQEKVALEMIPIVGALGGAAVNAAFTDHFQKIARGHFIIRRLEADFGPETVRRAFVSL